MKLTKHAFFEYLSEKKLAEPTEPSALAKCLRTFYVEARKKDGHGFLHVIFASQLCKYYKAKSVMDIINDNDFAEAKKVFIMVK